MGKPEEPLDANGDWLQEAAEGARKRLLASTAIYGANSLPPAVRELLGLMPPSGVPEVVPTTDDHSKVIYVDFPSQKGEK